jgi:hypothetical protein
MERVSLVGMPVDMKLHADIGGGHIDMISVYRFLVQHLINVRFKHHMRPGHLQRKMGEH